MTRQSTTGPRDSKSSKTKIQHGFAGVHEPMSQARLKHITEEIFKIAQRDLMRSGYVAPVLLVCFKESIRTIALATPDAIPEIIKKSEAKAIAYILVAKGRVKGPANAYQIVESINVYAKSHTDTYGALSIFTRDADDKPVFEEPIYTSEAYCRHLECAFSGHHIADSLFCG
ncbi:MAG: hypothetical protein ACOYL3_06700 [Desulfuromonadaceae bacterium]